MPNTYSPLDFASWLIGCKFTMGNSGDFALLLAARRLKNFRALSGRFMTARQAVDWLDRGFMVLADVGEVLSHGLAMDPKQAIQFEKERA